MTIILDTNQLPQNGSCETLSLRLLHSVASERGVSIAAPELVFVEWAAKIERDAQAAWQKASSALASASKYGRVPSLSRLDIPALVSERVEGLKGLIDVVPMPPACWEAALLREANRVPPTREGAGGRDAAIWLAAIAHVAECGDAQSYLVSANTRDFADPQDTTVLHPRLVGELADAKSLVLVTSTEAMLARLATRTAEILDVQGLGAMTSATLAVVRLIESDVLVDLDLPGFADTGGRYIASPPVVAPSRLEEQHAFLVADTPVALVSATYHASLTVGALRRAQGIAMSQVQATVHLDLPVRVWVRGTEPDADCEIVSVGTPRVVSAM